MQFPQRPKSHVIEDVSFQIFSEALPDDWIIREVTKKDYGVDCYIEICEESCLKGKLFIAQLKSSENIVIHGCGNEKYVSCSGINPATMNYWYNLPMPVFLFFVNIITKDIFFQDIKRFIRKNFYDFIKEELSTVKIPLDQKFMPINVEQNNKILNGIILKLLYHKEFDRSKFEFMVNDFISNLEHRLNVLAEHDHRDCFMAIEAGEPDYIELINTYNSMEFLCNYLNIEWKLKSLPDIIKEGKEMFGGDYFDYELYEKQMSEMGAALFPKFKKIAEKLNSMILDKEKDYWQQEYFFSWKVLQQYYGNQQNYLLNTIDSYTSLIG